MNIGDKLPCCSTGYWDAPCGPYERYRERCPRCHGKTYTLATADDVRAFERRRNRNGCEPAHLPRCRIRANPAVEIPRILQTDAPRRNMTDTTDDDLSRFTSKDVQNV